MSLYVNGLGTMVIADIHFFSFTGPTGPVIFFVRTSSDQHAVFDQLATGWTVHDRFGGILGCDQDDVRPLTGQRPMIVEVHHVSAATCADIQDQPDLVVAAKIGPVCQKHCAFQHVGVTERRPHIAYAVHESETSSPCTFLLCGR